MTAGNMIREARERLGWTQTQLANRIGVTPSAITKLEKDQLFLTTPNLIELSNLLVLDFEELLALVNEAKQTRHNQRIRVQGEAARKAFGLNREGEKPAGEGARPGPVSNAEQLGREILDDPDLTMAFRYLRAVFADPELKGAVLKTLEACAARANFPRADKGGSRER